MTIFAILAAVTVAKASTNLRVLVAQTKYSRNRKLQSIESIIGLCDDMQQALGVNDSYLRGESVRNALVDAGCEAITSYSTWFKALNSGMTPKELHPAAKVLSKCLSNQIEAFRNVIDDHKGYECLPRVQEYATDAIGIVQQLLVEIPRSRGGQDSATLTLLGDKIDSKTQSLIFALIEEAFAHLNEVAKLRLYTGDISWVQEWWKLSSNMITLWLGLSLAATALRSRLKVSTSTAHYIPEPILGFSEFFRFLPRLQTAIAVAQAVIIHGLISTNMSRSDRLAARVLWEQVSSSSALSNAHQHSTVDWFGKRNQREYDAAVERHRLSVLSCYKQFSALKVLVRF